MQAKERRCYEARLRKKDQLLKKLEKILQNPRHKPATRWHKAEETAEDLVRVFSELWDMDTLESYEGF